MAVSLCFKTGSHEPQAGLKRSQDLGAKMKMCLLVSYHPAHDRRVNRECALDCWTGPALRALESGNQSYSDVHTVLWR